MRPKTASIASNIPAFLSKLWKIVNDADTDHLICWSADGRSFVIQNQAEFWYNLLPIYYKHNNMSSFIRQLNMYGFHKISSESGGVECERDELKFYHPFFQQEQPSLMKLIKRKMASAKAPTPNPDEKVTNVDQISKVLVDVKQLRGRQESVDSQLAAMKQENAALWQELALLRQKHMKQQQIVNKLIHFLVHIVNPNRDGLGGLGVKRRYPLMINDARHTKSPKMEAGADGPTIHELETESALNDSLLKENKRNDPAQPLINENLLNLPVIDSPGALNDEMLMEDNAEKLLNATNPGTSAGIGDDFPLKDVMAAANEYIDINDFDNSSGDEGMLDDVQDSPGEHILNPSMRDAIISNFVSGTTAPSQSEPVEMKPEETSRKVDESPDKHVENQDPVKLNSVDDLDSHLESTQGELDSIKDILFDGYSLDANALLGNQNQSNNRFDGIHFQLFNPDGDFPLDVPPLTTSSPSDKNSNNEVDTNNYDPMMSGELMSYTNQPFVLDFDHLFEDPDTTMDGCDDNTSGLFNLNDDQSCNTLTTPIVIKKEPTFPDAKRNTK